MLETLENLIKSITSLNKFSLIKAKLLQHNKLILITGAAIVCSYFVSKKFFMPFEIIISQKKQSYQKYLAKQRPKRIILIRHGQTSANVQETVYAHVPNHLIELTQTGIDQALYAGQKLKEIVGTETVRFYVSPFKRTKETLYNILKSFKNEQQYNYQEDPRIREQEFGNLEKYQLDATERKKIKDERQIAGKFAYRYLHGESGADVFDRCTMFLDTLLRRIDNVQKRKYDNYVIVTHGMLMQLFIMRYFKLSIEQFEKLKNPANCTFWILLKNDQGLYSFEFDNQ